MFIPPRGRNVSRFRGPKSPAKVALPCVHLGPRVNVAGSVRDWRACAAGVDMGAGPGVVCWCKGCGVECPGYAAVANADPDGSDP